MNTSYGPWKIMMESTTWHNRRFWFFVWLKWRMRCAVCKFYELRYPWFYRELGEKYRGYYPVAALSAASKRLSRFERHIKSLSQAYNEEREKRLYLWKKLEGLSMDDEEVAFWRKTMGVDFKPTEH